MRVGSAGFRRKKKAALPRAAWRWSVERQMSTSSSSVDGRVAASVTSAI